MNSVINGFNLTLQYLGHIAYDIKKEGLIRKPRKFGFYPYQNISHNLILGGENCD